MLENHLQPKIEKIIVEVEKVWINCGFIRMGGYSAHCPKFSERAEGNFHGRMASLMGDMGWPAQSPNLSICYFFHLLIYRKKFSNIPLTPKKS